MAGHANPNGALPGVAGLARPLSLSHLHGGGAAALAGLTLEEFALLSAAKQAGKLGEGLVRPGGEVRGVGDHPTRMRHFIPADDCRIPCLLSALNQVATPHLRPPAGAAAAGAL